MTKALIPTEMSKGQHGKTKTSPKSYTASADRLRTVRWSNYSHPNWCGFPVLQGPQYGSMLPFDPFLKIYFEFQNRFTCISITVWATRGKIFYKTSNTYFSLMYIQLKMKLKLYCCHIYIFS